MKSSKQYTVSLVVLSFILYIPQEISQSYSVLNSSVTGKPRDVRRENRRKWRMKKRGSHEEMKGKEKLQETRDKTTVRVGNSFCISCPLPLSSSHREWRVTEEKSSYTSLTWAWFQAKMLLCLFSSVSGSVWKRKEGLNSQDMHCTNSITIRIRNRSHFEKEKKDRETKIPARNSNSIVSEEKTSLILFFSLSSWRSFSSIPSLFSILSLFFSLYFISSSSDILHFRATQEKVRKKRRQTSKWDDVTGRVRHVRHKD